MSQPKLTARQKLFVESYEGNQADAARKAGYKDKNPRNYASELVRTNPDVKKAIQSRLEEKMRGTIADRNERQQFWTEICRDAGSDISARLRASELLGKSEGDFIDRVQVEQSLDLTIALKKAEQRILSINNNDISLIDKTQTEPSSEIADGVLPAPPDHDIFS